MPQSSSAEQPATSSQRSVPISFTGQPRTQPRTVTKLTVLEKQLEKIAWARSKAYARRISLLVCWERDRTGAQDDLLTMDGMLKELGFECVTFVIKNDDQTPAWTLSREILSLLDPQVKASLPSPFCCYYAGHGDISNSSLREEISWHNIAGVLESAKLVDSLVILDCCHAAAARRSNSMTNIHIIAACGARDMTAGRSSPVSLSQRLSRSLRHSRSRGLTTVDWFLQAEAKKPENAPHAVFETFSGTDMISVIERKTKFCPSRIPRPVSGLSQAPQDVFAWLTLEGPGDTASDLEKVIRSLPRNVKAEVWGADISDASTLIELRMSWEAWILWTSVVHLEFRGVVLGVNLHWQ
ncbi:unnamed protein product [Penicillium olsonii]|nr:unnamed protein product [Penicillium olsonii]